MQSDVLAKRLNQQASASLANEVKPRPVTTRLSRISPELIAMMRNFVDAIENNSDPTIPLDLLRHSIEIAYDRLR